jgi:hypothetical protein
MQMPKIISQKTYQTLVAEKAALEAEVKKLKESASAMFAVDSEDGKKVIAEEVKAAVAEVTSQHNKALADLKAGYEKQISELQTTVAIESDSSEQKAIKTLAQIGVASDELPKTSNKDTASILDGLKGLQGQELSEYFNKNRAAIFAEHRKKNAAKQIK